MMQLFNKPVDVVAIAADWVPVVLSETEHYVTIKLPEHPVTETEAPLFLEHLYSLGYRYISGSLVLVCEKL